MWHAASGVREAWAYGGALSEGSSVQDAEMAAIDACVAATRARHGLGDGRPRLLILSDSHAVLDDVEGAWRGGSAWQTYRAYRQLGLLIQILIQYVKRRRQM